MFGIAIAVSKEVRRILSIFVLASVVLLFNSELCSALTIQPLADQNFTSQHPGNWKEVISAWVGMANEIYSKDLGIILQALPAKRVVAEDYGFWRRSDLREEEVFGQFQKFEKGTSDLVVWFSYVEPQCPRPLRMNHPYNLAAGGENEYQDEEEIERGGVRGPSNITAGMSFPLTPFVLVREVNFNQLFTNPDCADFFDDDFKSELSRSFRPENTLVHEMGHTFGAIHCADANSPMSSRGGKRFDSENASVMRALKDFKTMTLDETVFRLGVLRKSGQISSATYRSVIANLAQSYNLQNLPALAKKLDSLLAEMKNSP